MFHFARFPHVILLCLCLVPVGCVSNPAPKAEVKQTPVPPPAPPLDYEGMIGRSLLSAGNNARMKAVIARAKAGKEVTIACIGGSITEGAGAAAVDKNYASLAVAGFKDLFGTGRLVNAGMAGTPSTLGVIRYQRDVVQRAGGSPDIVIIEYAVNDGDDPTGGATYESLVRDILKARNAPAVVLLFGVFATQWNLQDRFIPLGAAYGLPMISIKNAIVPELRSGALGVRQFFADEYHPKDYGHRLMADCITHYWKTADAAAADPKNAPLPAQAVISSRFQGSVMIDREHIPAGVSVKPGSFTGKDASLGTFIHSPKEQTFPANWHKQDAATNDPLTLTLVCKNLLLVAKSSSSGAFGTAEISVDGKVVRTIAGNAGGSWNNPVTYLILDSEKAARHIVTVRMAEASAAKSFTIMAFGFSR